MVHREPVEQTAVHVLLSEEGNGGCRVEAHVRSLLPSGSTNGCGNRLTVLVFDGKHPLYRTVWPAHRISDRSGAVLLLEEKSGMIAHKVIKVGITESRGSLRIGNLANQSGTDGANSELFQPVQTAEQAFADGPCRVKQPKNRSFVPRERDVVALRRGRFRQSVSQRLDMVPPTRALRLGQVLQVLVGEALRSSRLACCCLFCPCCTRATQKWQHRKQKCLLARSFCVVTLPTEPLLYFQGPCVELRHAGNRFCNVRVAARCAALFVAPVDHKG
mmetsp:Transcript_2446/g.4579  ORF Transcript_2446/g.4579 Transcript_2446/m.4579 type:complete len:274 (+) Transcript_2446:2262-3083(+)